MYLILVLVFGYFPPKKNSFIGIFYHAFVQKHVGTKTFVDKIIVETQKLKIKTKG
jgi:hypothetical protein